MTPSKYRTIFGPIPSRRFGISLGIDLSPGTKQCNYDCLYCELAAAKPVEAIQNPPSVELVVDELKSAIKEHPDIEVITITANGEPTLYPFLDELIDRINEIKNGYKTLILTNASTIWMPQIQNSLAKLDIAKLSLDCATKECFKKLDRPLEGTELENIIEGIKSFRKRFKGSMIIEILMVPSINTSKREIEALNRTLLDLGADRIDIGTVDRPPAYPIEPLSFKELYEISKEFDPSLPIHIAGRHRAKEAKSSFSDEEILSTLLKRPLTQADIEALFDEESQKRFEALLQKGKIETKKLGGLLFYGTGFSKQKRKSS